MKKLRVLGIAPYEGMETLMLNLAEEYPEIELSTYVGDLQQGVEIVRSTVHSNFDVIISRGATAQMLREQAPLPVIEVEISLYDILCSLKLADGIAGKIAMLSFANITTTAKALCALLDYQIEIFTVESTETLESTLKELKRNNFEVILCDMIVNTTAKRMGLNSILITSGMDALRAAFRQAIAFCRTQEQLLNENHFLREIICAQLSHTAVFRTDGTLFFSSTGTIPPQLLDVFQRELGLLTDEEEHHLIRTVEGLMYAIRTKATYMDTTRYISFFYTVNKLPIPVNQYGIRFFSSHDIEEQFYSSLYNIIDPTRDQTDHLTRISQSPDPVMVCGEDGTGKEQIINMIYLKSPLKHHSLISINCTLLNDKSWKYLLEHHNSPFTYTQNTIYLSNIDALSQSRQRQLLAVLSEMNVCQQNKVFFSCVCSYGEFSTQSSALFTNVLSCLPLYLGPLRQRAHQLPSFVSLYLSHLNLGAPLPIVGMSPAAMELLQSFPWPHNFTQFKRILNELTMASSTQIIPTEEVQRILQKEKTAASFSPHTEDSATPLDLNRPLADIQQEIVMRVLAEQSGNQTSTAKQLGISRTTLWRILRSENSNQS